jgi:hypothetical protein
MITQAYIASLSMEHFVKAEFIIFCVSAFLDPNIAFSR